MKWIVAGIIGLSLALFPMFAFADNGSSSNDNDFLMRVGHDVYIPAGETVGSLVVIDGNVVIDGQVTHNVFVVRGDVKLSGSIGENLTVISGNIDLQSTAQAVNVTSIKGDLIRSTGSTVTGKVQEQDGFRVPVGIIGLFSILFWAAMTVAIIVAGLIFAAIGGRQLSQSARAMTDGANVIMGIVFVWAAIPFLAVLAVATLIGIPLGLGLLVFLLPALWFFGYIVAGARLGKTIVGFADKTGSEHPYAATCLGLVILQFGVLVPVLGGLVALIAGVWGGGAIAVTAFKAARGSGKGAGSTAPSPSIQTPQPAS